MRKGDRFRIVFTHGGAEITANDRSIGTDFRPAVRDRHARHIHRSGAAHAAAEAGTARPSARREREVTGSRPRSRKASPRGDPTRRPLIISAPRRGRKRTGPGGRGGDTGHGGSAPATSWHASPPRSRRRPWRPRGAAGCQPYRRNGPRVSLPRYRPQGRRGSSHPSTFQPPSAWPGLWPGRSPSCLALPATSSPARPRAPPRFCRKDARETGAAVRGVAGDGDRTPPLRRG